MSFLKKVERGIEGLNRGISGGLPEFDKATYGIQHGKIIGLVGSPKSGKTALLLQRYIIHPYLNGENIKWIFYSLEMSRDEIIARMISILADIHSLKEWQEAKEPGTKRFQIPESKILGLDDKLTPEEHDYVKKIYHLYIEPLMGKVDDEGNIIEEGRVEFIEDPGESNPTGISKHIMSYAHEHGELQYKTFKIKDEKGNTVEKKRLVGYKPNDDTKVWVIVDHVGLMKKEKELKTKENIDLFINEYAKTIKKFCKYTFILVSQLNRGIKSIDRMKFSAEWLQPQPEDIKDTSGLEETADIIYAIFNPNMFLHLKHHLGYNLEDFKGGYRSVHVIASRYTRCPVNKSLFFNVKTGRFIELAPLKSRELEAQLEKIRKL